MEIDTVLFDLDQTICVRTHSPKEVLERSFEKASVPQFCTEEELSRISDEMGYFEHKTEYYEKCLRIACERNQVDVEHAPVVARAYEEVVDHSEVDFLEEAETVLESLNGNYNLGIVSDGDERTQREKLEALGITEIFNSLVFATSEEYQKPNTQPFEDALDELGSVPEKSIHVGDSLEHDVRGANSAGIYSVWIPYERTSEIDATVQPDQTLEYISELPSFLDVLTGA